jgi:hypothetical protein
MNIDAQKRSAVKVLDWVNSSAALKGALSNVEGAKLDKPLPRDGASKEEWAAYLDNAERVAKAAKSYLEQQAAKGNQPAAIPAPPVPGRTAAPAQGGQYAGQVPGLSAGAARFY